MKKSSRIMFAVAAILLGTLLLFAAFHWIAPRTLELDEFLGTLLQHAPPGTSGILYVDVAQVRQSPFAQKLFAWAPKPEADAEYARFLQDTGFHYERDLSRIAFSAARRGQQSVWFAIADGSFDQKKITAYLSKIAVLQKRDSHDVYLIPANVSANIAPNSATNSVLTPAPAPISLTFLSKDRIAATNDADLSLLLAQKNLGADFPQWQTRFTRLAGSPVFVVVRQDASAANSLAAQAPGGLQSPQLSALLGQLTWLTLAGQPQSDSLRLVAEGETSNDVVSRQLTDMLNGIIILAQAGLNDPKTRQQINPEARAAYLQLLKTADVMQIDRQDTKAVRVVLEITPNFLNATTLPKPSPPTPTTMQPSAGAATPARGKTEIHKR
jgi:hypothetical protein